MKIEILFLKNLEKELRYLKPTDREEFISNYRLQIYDRYKSGEKITDIINSFEAPDLIAKNIYSELDINMEEKKLLKQRNWGLSKIFLGLSTILPQFLVFLVAAILLFCGALAFPVALYSFVMFFINFDALQAIGGALLAIGLLPFVGILALLGGVYVYKLEKIFFKISVELVTGREVQIFDENAKKSKRKAIIIYACLIVFGVFGVFGGIGSFAGNKTIGGAAISKEMLHTQNTELSIKDELEKNENKIVFNIEDLTYYSWYDIKYVKDANLEDKVLIKRDHNFKESIKVDYELKQKGESDLYDLELDNIPLNIKIFNISSHIFTITYNPDKVSFI